MAKEVKIIWFYSSDEGTEKAEQEIAQLLDKGWTIAAAGGDYGRAFIVLVKG